jgi:hypothetical protein
VRSNTQSAWVSNTVTITYQQIRALLELLQSLQNRWEFAEGKESGNVGEVDRCVGAGIVDQFEGWKAQYDDCCSCCRTSIDEADIQTSNALQFAKIIGE